MCVCVCVHIYIYIYTQMCVHCGCPPVSGILSPASLIWRIFLYLFWHEDHTKSWAHINLQDWKEGAKRTKDIGQLRVGLRQ